MASHQTNLYAYIGALFQQACYDLRNGRAILHSAQPNKGRKSIVLSLLHQSVEKGLKAAVLKVATAKGRNEEPDRIHQYWDVIDSEASLRGLKAKILASIAPYDGNQIRELGEFAPGGTNDGPNFEYPWPQRDGFEIPADFFDDSRFATELAKYEGISSSIIREVANHDKQLEILFRKMITASGKIREVEPIGNEENRQ